jgi:hypothetical protein
MLSKSECRAYIGYNNGSKAIKYYNATTRNILTSQNYKFLDIDMLPTPEEIGIDPLEISKDHLDQGKSSLYKGKCDLDSRDWDAQRRHRPDQDTGD